IALDVQLAGNGEEGLAAEKVAREVDFAVGPARTVEEVERGDAKERARAFGIGRGDDRRVDPEEAALVEEAVDRLRERVANARRRGDDVGARAKMRHLAQELERMRLRLDGIVVGILDPADDANGARLHL